MCIHESGFKPSCVALRSGRAAAAAAAVASRARPGLESRRTLQFARPMCRVRTSCGKLRFFALKGQQCRGSGDASRPVTGEEHSAPDGGPDKTVSKDSSLKRSPVSWNILRGPATSLGLRTALFACSPCMVITVSREIRRSFPCEIRVSQLLHRAPY